MEKKYEIIIFWSYEKVLKRLTKYRVKTVA